MRASHNRVAEMISALGRMTLTPGKGVTRPTFSKPYIQAMKYVADHLVELGLAVSVTDHGNLYGVWQGKKNAPPLLVGSHLDSVPNGGAFDGAAGVIGAIEAVRMLKMSGFHPTHPVAVVAFAEEEGARFGQLLTGSRAWVGELDCSRLTDETGLSYAEAAGVLKDTFTPATPRILSSKDALAMLEMHVEQSVVLEQCGIPVGIVTSIAGARQFRIRVQGVANHGGATPMNYRRDALAGVAQALARAESTVREQLRPSTVMTCGSIECYPGAPNVIPGEVVFSLDIRDIEPLWLDTAVSTVLKVVEDEVSARGLSFDAEELSATEAVSLDRGIVDLLSHVAQSENIPFIRIPSGAVHDAGVMAKIMPTGMIFVPSHDGRSHCPEEETRIEDMLVGIHVLARTIEALCG